MGFLDLVATVRKIAIRNNKYLGVLLLILTDEQNTAARQVWEQFEEYFVDRSKARRQALEGLVALSDALSKFMESKTK